LHSGIQNRDGGVARYYRSDSATNALVSTEITGYAASALTYLHSRTGNPEYLDAAVRAARYLTREVWDSAASTFPFEPGSDRAYFFDIGIIVRGLLAVWRATGEEQFRTRAQEATLSLAFDFLGDGIPTIHSFDRLASMRFDLAALGRIVQEPRDRRGHGFRRVRHHDIGPAF
jgi:uncharacterized protein YyaL (SSP411 family)